jgi:hypothetical protein
MKKDSPVKYKEFEDSENVNGLGNQKSVEKYIPVVDLIKSFTQFGSFEQSQTFTDMPSLRQTSNILL